MPLITKFNRQNFFKAHLEPIFALQTVIVGFILWQSASRLFPRAETSKCGIALLQPSTRIVARKSIRFMSPNLDLEVRDENTRHCVLAVAEDIL